MPQPQPAMEPGTGGGQLLREPEVKPTRTKSPRYDVYRVAPDGHLEPLATDVAAPTRKAAILKQDDPWGTFATVRVGELKIQTRDKQTREEEVWK